MAAPTLIHPRASRRPQEPVELGHEAQRRFERNHMAGCREFDQFGVRHQVAEQALAVIVGQGGAYAGTAGSLPATFGGGGASQRRRAVRA